MKQSNSTLDFLFIICASLVCYFSFLGHIHLFDWDEINFAECAREMIVTGDYWHVQIDFKPFHEKPPLFIWMQALSMQLFGINEYAARFPNAVCGLVTLLSLYFIGRKHVSRGFALAWVLTYIGSLLPHFYFKSGIIDPWFNYFIFISLYFIYRFFKSAEYKHLLFAGLFSGLAVFTKGPVAFLLLGITIFIFIFIDSVQMKKPMRWLFWLKSGLLFTLLSFLFLGLWYGLDIMYNGPTLFYDFIAYQIRLMNTEDAGHGGFPGYHVVVLLIGCFPSSFYFLYYLLKRKSLKQNQPLFLHWLLILFWVVLIIFSIVQSKIVHYSSLAYFPITSFSAYLIYTWLKKKNTIPKAIQYPILFFHLVLGILLILVPFIPQSFIQSLLDKDPFAKANFDVLLHWNSLSYGISIFYTLCVLGLFLYFKRYPRTRLIYTGQFLFSLLFLHLFFWFYLGNIEKITQGTAINFFQSLKGKAVYTGVYGYKSYAPFFYAEVQPDSIFNNKSREEVLVHRSLKNPVYLVSKINIEQSLLENGFTELVRLNGFVFFIKDSTTIR